MFGLNNSYSLQIRWASYSLCKGAVRQLIVIIALAESELSAWFIWLTTSLLAKEKAPSLLLASLMFLGFPKLLKAV